MKTTLFIILSLFIVSCGGSPQPQKGDKTTAPQQFKFKMPSPPMTLTDPVAIREWAAKNFWVNLNPADTSAIESDELKDAFGMWTMLLVGNGAAKSNGVMVSTFEKMAKYPEMHSEFLRLAEGFFGDPNSELRNDTLFLAMLDYQINSPVVPDVEKIRPAELKAMTLKNRVGEKAANIKWIDSKGKSGSLYGIGSTQTLMMFYTPGCEVCKGFFEAIDSNPEITSLNKAGKLTLLAIYTEGNKEEWEKYQKNIAPNWINGMTTKEFNTEAPYAIRATPSLYLIGGGKNRIVEVRDGATLWQIMANLDIK